MQTLAEPRAGGARQWTISSEAPAPAYRLVGGDGDPDAIVLVNDSDAPNAVTLTLAAPVARAEELLLGLPCRVEGRAVALALPPRRGAVVRVDLARP